MLINLLWTLSVSTRNLLRTWAPTNILLDHLRTRRGITCYLIALGVGLGYLALTFGTAWAVQQGCPKWLYLVFFLSLWNATKFILFIPIEAVGRRIHHVRAAWGQRGQRYPSPESLLVSDPVSRPTQAAERAITRR